MAKRQRTIAEEETITMEHVMVGIQASTIAERLGRPADYVYRMIERLRKRHLLPRGDFTVYVPKLVPVEVMVAEEDVALAERRGENLSERVRRGLYRVRMKEL